MVPAARILPALKSFDSGEGVILATCTVTVADSHFFPEIVTCIFDQLISI